MDKGEVFYRRKLLHWKKPDATYSITFRLRGSLPRQLQQQTTTKIRSVEQRGRLQKRPASEVEVQRVAVMEEYLDRDSSDQLFTEPKLAEIVRETLRFQDGKQYESLAWCIMPNHAHLLLKPMTAGDGGVP